MRPTWLVTEVELMVCDTWVGVDVGGTKVLPVRVSSTGEIEATATRPMPGRTAHAELVLGAAQGVDSMLMITIGTGIGGALVLGGRLVRGAHGLAGEFGHLQVVPDGLACECGLNGCWEQYCSGRALERVTRVALGRHLDGPEVAAIALGGDEVARHAFASVGTWLGVGVAGLVSAFDPELVVIGGGVSTVGDLLLDPARRALRESLQGTDHRTVPPLVPALLGPESSAVGAALLARGRSTP